MARPGSDMASPFICVRTSSNCCGGRVLSVCEMTSVHLRFGGSSTPAGKGGRAGAASIGMEGTFAVAVAS